MNVIAIGLCVHCGLATVAGYELNKNHISPTYLGGVIDKNLNHETAVDARISKASAAFGKLKGYVFASKDISLPAKRAAYVALVLSILLYGCECWAITASMRRKVQSFHNRCSRIMCGINMWHVKEQHTSRLTLFSSNWGCDPSAFTWRGGGCGGLVTSGGWTGAGYQGSCSRRGSTRHAHSGDRGKDGLSLLKMISKQQG